MVSEHLGDVHDEINNLCDLVGIPQPEGDFQDGWTQTDWNNVGKAEEGKYGDWRDDPGNYGE